MNNTKNILYSDLPRSIVYKDVEDINECIGGESDETMEREFYNKLMELPFIKEAIKPHKDVLKVFNNANYIYMMVEAEYDPSLFNFYLMKAGDGTDDQELRNYITASTMALLYNGLGNLLCSDSFTAPKEQIIEYRQKIYDYFKENGKNVPQKCREVFLSLLVEDGTLMSKTMTFIPFSIPLAEDFTQTMGIPVLDIAKGIDYIIECYAHNDEPDDFIFLEKLLDRLENEKSFANDTKVVEQAIQIIQNEIQRLKHLPKKNFDLGLSIDNIIPVPDTWDNSLSAMENETDPPHKSEIEVDGEEPKKEEEWDNRYDGFLKDNLNPEEICEALKQIQSPHLLKAERGFWWTFYRVLGEIGWLDEMKGNKKMVLLWANQHFDIGWDWSKDNLFKFSDITHSDVIRNKPISEWNKNNVGREIGDHYKELAKEMKETFVEYVNGGKMRDRNRFIKTGARLINNGSR